MARRTPLGSGVLISENLADVVPLTGRRMLVVAPPIKFRGGNRAVIRITIIDIGSLASRD